MLLQDIYFQDLKIPFEAAKLNTALVKQIQTRLKDVGLYFGAVDGIYGPQTDKALEEFCKRTWVNNFETKVIGKTLAELLIEAKPYLPEVAKIVTKARVDQFFGRVISDEQYKDLLRCLELANITTVPRINHFLAQISVESGNLRWLTEIWGPTPVQRGYEGRRDLGNTVSGDGFRFRGAGAIMVTGRANFQAVANFLGDQQIMVEGADRVSKLYPFSSAAVWWNRSNLNKLIDSGFTCKQVTKVVNGGYTHLAERETAYSKAVSIFK